MMAVLVGVVSGKSFFVDCAPLKGLWRYARSDEVLSVLSEDETII